MERRSTMVLREEDRMKVPVEILLHSERRTLELVYEDGVRAEFTHEFLRVNSPSAEVQGHSPEEAQLQVGKRDVAIASIEPIGNYALKIGFTDGHDTGLFSWDYFEELARTKDVRWETYLKDLAEAGASRDPNDPANKPFESKPRTRCGGH